MTVTISAIYENGVLKPQRPLGLAEGAEVQVTINSPTENATWSEGAEKRRHALIDKDIAGAITSDELFELERLDQLANDCFDKIAPPPVDGARRLHERLLNQRAHEH